LTIVVVGIATLKKQRPNGNWANYAARSHPMGT
jgi:hypothetical protein